MWRVGRRGRTLLACVLVVGFTCPPAMATPEGQSTQTYGQPPVWGGCETFVGDTSAIPTAQCGTVSVPVDYAKPEGAQAQLAVIRIPATGDRIGVLMVNPGGPGASAVDTVAGMGVGLAGTQIAGRFDLVGFDPRGVGHSTPELRCRTDAEFDAYRREPNVDYSPAGVAHIEDLYRQFAQDCAAPGRQGSAGQRRHSLDGQGHGRGAGGARREPDQLSRLLVRHRDRIGVRAGISRPCARHGARRGGRPDAWTRSKRTCVKWPDSRRHSTTTPPTARSWRDARSAPTRAVRQPVPPAGRPAGHAARDGRSDPRGLSYADAITGTVNALYSRQYWKFLTSGLLGLQRETDPGDLLLLADDYLNRDTGGPLPELAGRVLRHPLRQLAVPDRPGGVGRRRPTGAAGRTVPQLRLVHRPCAAGHLRELACPPRRPRRTPRSRPARARSSSCPPPTTRPRRIRPVSTWPSRWTPPDHVRRHPTHRGVQRRRVRRQRGGRVPRRPSSTTTRPALLGAGPPCRSGPPLCHL